MIGLRNLTRKPWSRRQFAFVRKLAKADAAQAELTVVSTGTTAAVQRLCWRVEYFGSRLDLAIIDFFAMQILLSSRRHYTDIMNKLILEREAELIEQGTGSLVRVSGGHERDVHTARAVHLVVFDLGEDQLLGQTQKNSFHGHRSYPG